MDSMTAVPGRQRIVIVQTTIPDYRVPFFNLLSRRLGPRLLVVAGNEDFAQDVAPAPGVNHLQATNRFLFQRLLWQTGVLPQVVRCEVAILVLNPRILSSWVGLITRRILNRPTILWGHCWPRSGAGSKTDRVRGVMRRLADGLIVYTEKEAVELRGRCPGVKVAAAPNALYEHHQMLPSTGIVDPTDFIFVGRLTPAKKPQLLLEAFRQAAPSLDSQIRLVFVGNGSLRVSLETEAARVGLQHRVRFLGHVSDPEQLRETYAVAIASISPGYAGLSLIQSLGFGVPMIIASGEPHAPEIEAAAEGENVAYFPRDEPAALTAVLLAFARDRELWLARREEIGAPIRSRYSIEGMVDSFVAALQLEREQPESDGDSAASGIAPVPSQGDQT